MPTAVHLRFDGAMNMKKHEIRDRHGRRIERDDDSILRDGERLVVPLMMRDGMTPLQAAIAEDAHRRRTLTENKEINAALADHKIKARLADLGSAPLVGSAADFGKLIADETEKWGKVIWALNIKAE
jgi:hypothetical protein